MNFRLNLMISKAGKVGGIIISICMIIIGIFLFATPFATSTVMSYIAAIGILVFGAYGFIMFFVNKDKNGWALAMSIVFIILGILLLSLDPQVMYILILIVMGVGMAIGAVNSFAAISPLKAEGRSIAPAVIGGILAIVLLVFLCIFPFVTSWIIWVFIGAFLLIDGIILLVDCASMKTK